MAIASTFWRRAIATAFIVAGALILWLSPDQVIGAVTMMAGIALEVVGIHLEHT